MRRIDRGAEPVALTTYRSATQNDPNRNLWSAVNCKPMLRTALHSVQQQCCAYCGVEIEDDHDKSKLEHIHPQNEAASWTACCDRDLHGGQSDAQIRPNVSWPNLFLCCVGQTAGKTLPTLQHCDSAKGGIHACDLLYPDDPSLLNTTLVEIDDEGNVYPARTLSADDQVRLLRLIGDAGAAIGSPAHHGVLNLNAPRLRDARRQFDEALTMERSGTGSTVGVTRQFPWIRDIR